MARAEGACRRRDLGAQVGDAVGLLGIAGGLQPLGPPVGRPQRRREPGRGRDRPPVAGRATRLHRPLVRRVGGEGRSPVGDEGLAGGRHRAAVPGEPELGRVGPAHHDAEGRLRDGAARCLQGPGERAVVGIDADGVGEAVHRERRRSQRATRRGRGTRAPQRPVGVHTVGHRGAGRERAGYRGARGDAGGRGEEGAPAEPVHVTRPRSCAPCRGCRRCSTRCPTATPRCRPASPSG